jgi:photosystem II stability/assembly factor-like uncharacterized protein
VVGFPDSGYATIYHTTDGGKTWERKGSSNPASKDYVPDVALYKVHAAGDHVWAVGDDGTILHTGNGGETWTNYKQDGYNNILQGVYTLGGNTVWVTGGTRGMNVPDDYGIIFKTINAGLTWTRHEVNVDDLSFILAISAADDDTAWAVGGPGFVLLKTTDGGTSWTRQSKGVGGLGDLNEVYAVNTSTAWVAADTVIYWSTDGGENWENSGDHGLVNDLAYMGVSAVSDQKAWASHAFSGGSIVRTTDGGTNWTKVETLGGEALPGLMTISFATQPINPIPSQSIPALSPWGTLVLFLMIAGSFLWMVCRKKRTASL